MFIVISSFFYSLSLFADVILFIKDEPKPPNYLIGNDYEIYRKKTFIKMLFLFSICYIGLMFYYTWFLYDKPKYSDFKGDITLTFIGVFMVNKLLNQCFILALDKHKDFIKICNFFFIVIVYDYSCKF